MGRVHGLGRGLEALIPAPPPGAAVEEIALDRIAPNPHQPREHFDDERLADLAESIRVHGVLQPIVVRPTLGGYELIAGERRVRAARLAGLSRVPAVVRGSDGSDQLELALTENLQRADLGAMEEAEGYRELADRFGLTHEAIAARVGKSRAAISNAIRLLELAPETRRAIVDGRISEGHGRALGALTVHAVQRAVLDLVLRRGLSVRQTEELVRRRRTRPERLAAEAGARDGLAELEGRLRALLATRVSISRSRRGGRLVIDFYSDEDLERVYGVIERGAAAGAAS